jgi:ATP-dependent helicase/nuclease subunit A
VPDPGAESSARPILARMPVEDSAALVTFHARFETERRSASRRTISQLIERAVAAGGYREHVLGLEWGERRLANVHKLLRLARRFEASEGRDLRGFLDHAAHHQERAHGMAVVAEPDAPVAGAEPDAVRLMSIHAAKGLEFPVVCVADLGRAPNMSVPDLLLDGERIGLRLARLDGAEAIPSLEFDELCQDRKRAQAEEEERILYVAMTRARERLILSGSCDFERWPDARQGAPTISWLGPALATELPMLVKAREQPIHDLAAGASGRATVRCRLNVPASASEAREERGRPLSSDPSPSEPTPLQLSFSELSSLDRSSAELFSEERSSSEPCSRRQASGRRSAAVEAAGPETLSYTALSELERCGYRYYLERVLGLPENRSAARPEPGREGLDARARGTLVHRLLETTDFARPVAHTPEDVAQAARALGVRAGPREREELATLVGTAAESELAERIAAADGVRREHPFAFASPAGPLITGVIDLLAHEGGDGRLVVDYKSDRVSPEDDLPALVSRDYGLQRMIYALAVLRDGARKVEIIHWFLQRPREWVAAHYTAEDRPRLEKSLAEQVMRARTSTFAVSERPHRSLCLTCPGRGSLCSWSEAETMMGE